VLDRGIWGKFPQENITKRVIKEMYDNTIID